MGTNVFDQLLSISQSPPTPPPPCHSIMNNWIQILYKTKQRDEVVPRRGRNDALSGIHLDLGMANMFHS